MRISLLGQWSESLPPLSDPPQGELSSVYSLLESAEKAEQAGLLMATVAYLRAALETQLRDLAESLTGLEVGPRSVTCQTLQALREGGYITIEQQRFIGRCHALASALIHNRSADINDYGFATSGIRFIVRVLQQLEGGASHE